MAASLTFLGAAGTVTGARFFVEADGVALLLECGMFQGLRELRARNWAPPPVHPTKLAAVLLSHAHIDHSGCLPRLVRDGFAGPIFCSPGTADLLRIMLPDAARLQEEEAEYRNRRGITQHRPALRARACGRPARGDRGEARLAVRRRGRRPAGPDLREENHGRGGGRRTRRLMPVRLR